MSMSKGDYVRLAEAIMAAREQLSIFHSPGRETVLSYVADKIADVCANGSPRFDRERFLRAALLGDFSVPKGKVRRERDARINAAVREVLK